MVTQAKFWDKAAAKYAKSPISDMPAYEYSLDRTLSYLGATDRVLELGCGTGSTALLIAPHVGQMLATDCSAEMIKIGRDKATAQGVSNLGFEQAEMEDVPTSRETYDAVLAFNALHMVADTGGVLANIHAQLKPGGYFISKTFAAKGQKMPLKMRAMLWVLPLFQRLGKVPFVNFYSVADLEDAITTAGFKIVETGNYPSAPTSRFIVAVRE